MKLKSFQLILFLFLSFHDVEGQAITAWKASLKSNLRQPRKFKGFWKGVKVIAFQHQKNTGQNLNKFDTLYIVLRQRDDLLYDFEEARLWNSSLDLRAYTFYENLTSGKELMKRKLIYGAEKVDGFPVMQEIDLIKKYIEKKDTIAIYSNTRKCQVLGGSRYWCFVIQRMKNKYSTLMFVFGNLCYKQPKRDAESELQD